MSLYQIAYASRNQIKGEQTQIDEEILSILAKARENNRRKNITGALLFNGCFFAQVLEGALPDIEAIYERILCDPRHSDIVMLSRAATDERTFYEWSMAYADPVAVQASPRMEIDFQDALVGGRLAGPRILAMLRTLVVHNSE